MDSEFVGERVVETTRMLRTRALVVAPSQDAEDLVKRGHFITPSFMVKKKKMKKKRMVYNQKRCNREFRKKRVKLENLASVNKAARRNGKAFSADVGAIANKGKDGYHMVEIDPRDQKYLTSDQGARVREASLGPPDRQAILDQAGVDIEGMSAEEISQYWGPVPQFVMCAGLPFGYQNSVWLFTLVQREIARVLRSQHGIRCSHYLDDWIFYPETDEEGLRWQPIIDRVWAEHGQMRQVGKGTVDDNNVWHIVQELEHLGSGISFRTNVFFVTPDMLSRIRKEAKSILVSYDRHQGRIGALWLAQFAGLVMSQHQAVRSARFSNKTVVRRSGSRSSLSARFSQLGAPESVVDTVHQLVVGAQLEPGSRSESVGPAGESSVDVRRLYDAREGLGGDSAFHAADRRSTAVAGVAVCGDLVRLRTRLGHHTAGVEGGAAVAGVLSEVAEVGGLGRSAGLGEPHFSVGRCSCGRTTRRSCPF